MDIPVNRTQIIRVGQYVTITIVVPVVVNRQIIVQVLATRAVVLFQEVIVVPIGVTMVTVIILVSWETV